MTRPMDTRVVEVSGGGVGWGLYCFLMRLGKALEEISGAEESRLSVWHRNSCFCLIEDSTITLAFTSFEL